MPLRFLLRYLLNNEQMIQRLAESYPVKRAARLTAYFYYRAKDIGEETVKTIKESDSTHRMKEEAKEAGERVQSFQRSFSREIRDGFQNLKEEIKKKDQK